MPVECVLAVSVLLGTFQQACFLCNNKVVAGNLPVTSASSFRLIDLILEMTFLPVWNTHCTRVRFTVIVSCSYSDEFAVHSCPLLFLQRWVTKVPSGLLYCWSSLRNNNMATNLYRLTLYCGSRLFVAWETVERTHLGKQCSDTVTCW